jgi:hypothetical protein
MATPRSYARFAALPTLAVALACTIALAACGSSASSSGTSTGPGNGTSLAFAQCTRAHGVPNFPDPLPSGGFARGIDRQSPAFQTAQKGCIHILKAGAAQQRPTAAQRAAAVTYARCMRAHGVPNFPDPVTSSPAPNTNAIVQGGLIFPLGSTIDPNSPAFKHADATCGHGSPSGPPKGG